MSLESSQNSREETCCQVSFLITLQVEVTASDLSRVFFYWRFLVNSISTEKWIGKREIPWWRWNVYYFARVLICLTSKTSKEIWKMVIWSVNVFKGNLILQFSWLEKFRQGKVSWWWTLVWRAPVQKQFKRSNLNFRK